MQACGWDNNEGRCVLEGCKRSTRCSAAWGDVCALGSGTTKAAHTVRHLSSASRGCVSGWRSLSSVNSRRNARRHNLDDKTKTHAVALREWVQAKPATNAEPPSSWFRLMKLREDIDAVLAAQESYIQLAVSDGEEVVPEVIPVNLP